jgi:hypothetical protein
MADFSAKREQQVEHHAKALLVIQPNDKRD